MLTSSTITCMLAAWKTTQKRMKMRKRARWNCLKWRTLKPRWKKAKARSTKWKYLMNQVTRSVRESIRLRMKNLQNLSQSVSRKLMSLLVSVPLHREEQPRRVNQKIATVMTVFSKHLSSAWTAIWILKSLKNSKPSKWARVTITKGSSMLQISTLTA